MKMRYFKIFVIAASFIFISAFSFVLGQMTEEAKVLKNIKLDVPIRSLLIEPDETSEVSYNIPIGVKLLECTPDKKWYKAQISYDFLGHYEFEGWCKVEK